MSWLVPAIAGGVSLASSFLGGGNKSASSRYDPITRKNNALLDQLEGEYGDARTKDATETQFYQQGMADVRDQMQDRADQDERMAVARGLQGSEFEIAQADNRGRQRTRSRRGLLTSSQQQLDQDRYRMLRALLQQQGNVNALQTGQARLAAEEDRRANNAIQNAIGTAAMMYAQPRRGKG